MPSPERDVAGPFAVDLTRLNIPPETKERMVRAIQKAVLLEVASLDIAPKFSVRLEFPEGFGEIGRPTDGIWIAPIEPMA